MSTGRTDYPESMDREQDDALTWDGDDDPTLAVPPLDPEVTSRDAEATPAFDDDPAIDEATVDPLPKGWTAVGRGSEELTADALGGASDDPAGTPDSDDLTEAPATGMSNAMLITVGVLAGSYLLFAIGWLLGGLRLHGYAQFLVSPVAYQVSVWLAVLAPVIWFGTVMLLTARRAAWVRVVWLVVGAVLLVPWPFVMMGAVGQ